MDMRVSNHAGAKWKKGKGRKKREERKGLET
jgi:hypothetical protein